MKKYRLLYQCCNQRSDFKSVDEGGHEDEEPGKDDGTASSVPLFCARILCA